MDREQKARNKIKEGTSKPSPQKYWFLNKITRKSQSTINTSNSNFNANIPQWSEASSSEEEDIGICKCRIKVMLRI